MDNTNEIRKRLNQIYDAEIKRLSIAAPNGLDSTQLERLVLLTRGVRDLQGIEAIEEYDEELEGIGTDALLEELDGSSKEAQT